MLKGRGTTPLDAIIVPIDNLLKFAKGQAIMTLINIAIGNIPYDGPYDSYSMCRYAICYPSTIPERYQLPDDYVDEVKLMSRDMKDLFYTYFDM